jgi:hypothetical protein
MITTIAKMNPNAMLDTVERISQLADEMHWEVKT